MTFVKMTQILVALVGACSQYCFGINLLSHGKVTWTVSREF